EDRSSPRPDLPESVDVAREGRSETPTQTSGLSGVLQTTTDHYEVGTTECILPFRTWLWATRDPGPGGGWRGTDNFLPGMGSRAGDVRSSGDRRGIGRTERGDGGGPGRCPSGADREGAPGGRVHVHGLRAQQGAGAGGETGPPDSRGRVVRAANRAARG